MNKQKKIIFVDSDAFVALAKEDDTNHKKAIQLLEKLLDESVIFLTSNYVFSETVTVLSMRVGHAQAIAFIDKLKASDSGFEIRQVTAHIDEEAIAVFKKQSSKNTSFVDCTNMVFLKELREGAIFSFDEVYTKNGFRMVEDLF